MTKQSLPKRILSLFVVVTFLFNILHTFKASAQEISFECIFNDCTQEDYASSVYGNYQANNNSSTEENQLYFSTPLFGNSNPDIATSNISNQTCSDQGKGVIIGGARDGECGSCPDSGNSYYWSTGKYKCSEEPSGNNSTKQDDSNNNSNSSGSFNGLENFLGGFNNSNSPEANNSDCSNNSEISKIVINRSERKLRTYTCQGKQLKVVATLIHRY
jgi:hypothetical protein